LIVIADGALESVYLKYASDAQALTGHGLLTGGEMVNQDIREEQPELTDNR
jgi:hypothetical protein